MHQLDNLTATQLAAGATLDRPAAVVRELIDNADGARGLSPLGPRALRGGRRLRRPRVKTRVGVRASKN